MNEYQAENLLGMLLRCHPYDRGDYYGELAWMAFNVLEQVGKTLITNNYGDIIPLEKFWDTWKKTGAEPLVSAYTPIIVG